MSNEDWYGEIARPSGSGIARFFYDLRGYVGTGAFMGFWGGVMHPHREVLIWAGFTIFMMILCGFVAGVAGAFIRLYHLTGLAVWIAGNQQKIVFWTFTMCFSAAFVSTGFVAFELSRSWLVTSLAMLIEAALVGAVLSGVKLALLRR